jgi:hypothetical protein
MNNVEYIIIGVIGRLVSSVRVTEDFPTNESYECEDITGLLGEYWKDE